MIGTGTSNRLMALPVHPRMAFSYRELDGQSGLILPSDDESQATGGKIDGYSALWKAQEVAQYLSVPISTVRYWTSKGFIPFIKLPAAVRFQPEVIIDWARSMSKGGTPAVARKIWHPTSFPPTAQDLQGAGN